LVSIRFQSCVRDKIGSMEMLRNTSESGLAGSRETLGSARGKVGNSLDSRARQEIGVLLEMKDIPAGQFGI